ncbi:unnamed protein product [Acanthoscelides obtectus]|uniref:Uncharacterized protein n=1 Tax=Acanthoscelides obtectus TaxID=200917 RepID=A0A9P0L0L1_ACAOB|nr:unnamed protein product [Acanthoscelides obtectus]CAK1661194.1 hypothetical protein AOBTE_LOCUS22507 [Acanthoscelides obtectus]
MYQFYQLKTLLKTVDMEATHQKQEQSLVISVIYYEE